MGKTYEHISDSERRRIDRLRESGKSLRVIAQELGRSVSTVSEELQRNCVHGTYEATKDPPVRKHESGIQIRVLGARQNLGAVSVLQRSQEKRRTQAEDEHLGRRQSIH